MSFFSAVSSCRETGYWLATGLPTVKPPLCSTCPPGAGAGFNFVLLLNHRSFNICWINCGCKSFVLPSGCFSKSTPRYSVRSPLLVMLNSASSYLNSCSISSLPGLAKIPSYINHEYRLVLVVHARVYDAWLIPQFK
jgi:hypothetical protein